MVIADIGHWESEQFTIELLHEVLQAKFPNFAVLKTKIKNQSCLLFFIETLKFKHIYGSSKRIFG